MGFFKDILAEQGSLPDASGEQELFSLLIQPAVDFRTGCAGQRRRASGLTVSPATSAGSPFPGRVSPGKRAATTARATCTSDLFPRTGCLI